MADYTITKIIKYFQQVPEKITREVNKEIPSIMKNTKKTVKDHLKKGNGVNKGIYKKNIIYRKLTNDPNLIEFQVGGNKRHYRLTHLLEHGHRLVRKGIVYGKTKSIPHIKPGQDYADEKVLSMYDKAIDLALRGKE